MRALERDILHVMNRRLRPMKARYKVTGTDRNGRRFAAIYTDSAMHASGINLFAGTVWQFDGEKYRVVYRVWN